MILTCPDLKIRDSRICNKKYYVVDRSECKNQIGNLKIEDSRLAYETTSC